jgi:ASCH domain-containing protein
LKAISVKQPWANMIAAGKKTIETRTWATKYRGPVLIVSSRSPRIEPAGYAVAVAEIAASRPMTRADERAARCKLYPKAQAWVLKGVLAIRPFPVKGSLGLYNIRVAAAALTRPASSRRQRVVSRRRQ